ncbi:MAG: DUF885 family protein [Bacteroidota bacterium]
MYRYCLIGTLWLFLFSGLQGQSNTPENWKGYTEIFASEYSSLGISGLSLSFVINLDQIASPEDLKKEERFFQRMEKEIETFDPTTFSTVQLLEYHLLRYHISLHQERLRLEQAWAQNPPETISQKSLAALPNGKDWYAYFLKRWVDIQVDPDSLYVFGQEQVARAKKAMKDIQLASGMDSLSFQTHLADESFFFHSAKEAKSAFQQFHKETSPILEENFPYLAKVPPVNIQEGTDPNLAKVPGFYRNDTFFFNYFDKPYNKRQLGWLYMHEALPGHHYERSLRASLGQTDLQNLFWIPCYAEGWAAYIEEIAIPIQAYRDVYEEYGKWEWDLIRSVRVMLDVGLNYYGWSDEKALDTWKEHIQGIDEIGEREIARMKRWPAQVITYKYGADKLLTLSQKYENLYEYHKALMDVGPLPFSVLDELLAKGILNDQ